MAKEYFCKYCGHSHAALSFLMSGVCSKSPNKRHQLYVGTGRGYQGRDKKYKIPIYHGRNYHYYCKYCGHPHVTISDLTSMRCKKSPTGYHQPYEGEDKPIYICKYCTSTSRSIEGLTRGSCSRSPNKHHQPEL